MLVSLHSHVPTMTSTTMEPDLEEQILLRAADRINCMQYQFNIIQAFRVVIRRNVASGVVVQKLHAVLVQHYLSFSFVEREGIGH
jgi:hypothetical protein